MGGRGVCVAYAPKYLLTALTVPPYAANSRSRSCKLSSHGGNPNKVVTTAAAGFPVGLSSSLVKLAALVLPFLLVGFGPCPANSTVAGGAPPKGHHLFCKKPIKGPQRFVPNGPWQTWHDSGKPYETGVFRDGRRDGPWQVRDVSGALLERGTWSNGVRSGRWVLWRADEAIDTGTFKDNVRIGSWTSWRLAPDRRAALHPSVRADQVPVPGFVCKVSEGRYDRGVKTGMWRDWMPCAGLARERSFVDGQWHGIARTFWPNGKVATEGSGVHGRATGTLTSWDADGNRILLERFLNDKKEGAEESWYPDGARKSLGHFVAGEAHGTRESWFPDGARESVSEFAHGQPIGISITWHPNGQMRTEIDYRSGEPTRRDWDVTGQLQDHQAEDDPKW